MSPRGSSWGQSPNVTGTASTRAGAPVAERVVESVEVAGRLEDKVVVITGAGSGTGREAAVLFSAGVMLAGDESVVDTDEMVWEHVLRVNATGVFLCCKRGIPHLLARGSGSVINVASFVALMGAASPQAAYTASKGAVLSMTRELAVEFARSGVRVNALCPGPVETPLLMRLFADDQAAFERRRVHLPMGRLAKPREVAQGALFLANDESSYVTGATFLVDGGITAAYVTPE
jgi:NAD(P)-dependent dehydrogenase (short-subunit alcohol dehydrogenase family)